jgi:1-acyl-sn-glycerol-3-phosphate acyltransferase
LISIELRILLVATFNYKKLQPYLSGEVKTWTKTLINLAQLFSGLRIQINYTQLNLPDRFIIISNHQSLVDIPALMASFRNHLLLFVAKKELGRFIPGASRVLRMQHHALIDRTNNLLETARDLKKFAKSSSIFHGCPVIFPEGTRSTTGILKPFQSGAYKILQNYERLPIVVITIDGGQHLSHLSHFRKKTSQIYRMKLLSVIDPPEKKSDIQETLDKARTLISNQLLEWRNPI